MTWCFAVLYRLKMSKDTVQHTVVPGLQPARRVDFARQTRGAILTTTASAESSVYAAVVGIASHVCQMQEGQLQLRMRMTCG
jgi:hypothetical protein